MLRKELFLFICFCILSFVASAVDFDVRIFSNVDIKSVQITPLSGKYVIYSDSKKVADLYKNNSVTLSVVDGKISLVKQGENLGNFTTLVFSPEGFLNTFTLAPLEPSMNSRVYDDGIKFFVVDDLLRIINRVELEHYVAGIVESEGGVKKNLEFLKVQAIISRTYAISNLRKHLKDDGYNFCDNTHCQLYRGRCTNSMIMLATSQTAGDVIIDQTSKPISAAFFSNCGGETMNSEDVWSISTTYLKSIKDTFCLKQSQATWTKKIVREEWIDYLSKKFSINKEDSLLVKKACSFIQNDRHVYLNDDPNIPLKTIRNDWKLKSTFFSIEDSGDTLVFRGRGYGHGVGLCQEGAMHMVDLGWTFKSIIKYYYTDVSIINISELKSQ